MPGKLDGVGLARTIRERHPKLPILLLTGYSGNGSEVDVPFPVLRKPYQLHELSRELEKLTHDPERLASNGHARHFGRGPRRVEAAS
jgi:DNA-binding LytR/AlgR family response regulator